MTGSWGAADVRLTPPTSGGRCGSSRERVQSRPERSPRRPFGGYGGGEFGRGCGSESVSIPKVCGAISESLAPVVLGGLFAKACRAVGHEVCVERAAGYRIMQQTQ